MTPAQRRLLDIAVRRVDAACGGRLTEAFSLGVGEDAACYVAPLIIDLYQRLESGALRPTQREAA